MSRQVFVCADCGTTDGIHHHNCGAHERDPALDKAAMLKLLAIELDDWPKGCDDCARTDPAGWGWRWVALPPGGEIVLCADGTLGDEWRITERDWMEACWADGEERMDAIGPNGPSGEHYDAIYERAMERVNAYQLAQEQGRKDDAAKPRLDLLLADMPHALEAIAMVLTHGAEKYAPGNWLNVPDAQRRYLAAGARHELELAKGVTHDAETGEHHLAHAACCLLFRLELLLREDF